MKKIFLGLTIIIPLFLFGQNEINNISLPDNTKKELIELSKDLYDIEVNISFNISSKDLKSSFDDMSAGKKYDKPYLNILLEKIKSDSLNPIYLNNIADYYSKTSNLELANKYYFKSLKCLDIKYLNNDSAYFYSFSGILKFNLGDTSAIIDFSKSLEFNPNDSIAMYFYPLILISNGDFTKSRELIKKLFKEDLKCVSLPYLYLTMTEVFESFQNIIKLEKENEDYRKIYINKNYNEIIDYTLLDKYLADYQENNEVENCRSMADLLGIFYKIILFEQDSNHKVVLNYNNFEINKIHEIISKLTELEKRKKLNEYSFNKCLGYAYFITEDWDKSINCFNKAIAVFPNEKKDEYFNSDDCYDAIITINYQKSDTLNFREAINSKMASKSGRGNTIDELTLLAIDYFRCGDLVKTEEYCKKIREIDSNNFDALRLLSNINFIKGSMYLAQFYGENAGKNLRNENDNYNLIMQFAIYQIYSGDFKTAFSNIEIAKQINDVASCPLCDKLLKIIETK